MNMDLSSKWNILDKMIFAIENLIKTVKENIHENFTETEPDVELMIAAETEHLRSENESLKKRETPIYLIEDGAKVLCPNCEYCIQDKTAKYCPNCGHRVIKHIEINRYKSVETP